MSAGGLEPLLRTTGRAGWEATEGGGRAAESLKPVQDARLAAARASPWHMGLFHTGHRGGYRLGLHSLKQGSYTESSPHRMQLESVTRANLGNLQICGISTLKRGPCRNHRK